MGMANFGMANFGVANFSNEGVAASGKRGDIVRLAGVVIKYLAEDGDGLIQVVLVHRGSGPDTGDQFGTAETVAVMLDQHDESIKHLGREYNGTASTQKTASGGIEAKRAKLVEVPRHREDTAFTTIYFF
jgi:hypothetical protein